MSDPINRNPLTGRTPGLSAFDYVDKAQQSPDRITRQGTKLESFSTDKVGINQRRNGHVKVGAFHVFNVLTLGIVGYVGKLAANSSRMGSQKSGWLTNMVKDYGQTYLNATRDSGKFINTATRVWSEGLGSITTLGLGPLGRLIQNSSHNKAVNRAFGNRMQREFGAQLNYNSVKDLNRNTVKQSARIMYEQLHAELQTATNRADAVSLTGSDSLKAAFMQARKEDYDPQYVLFHQWARPALDKLDPQSSQHDPNYSLSKHELLTVQKDFFDTYGKHAMNLSHSDKPQIDRAVHQALGDYSRRLDQAETEIRIAKNELKKNPNLKTRQIRLQNAQQDLQNIKNERLTPQQSQALVGALDKADKTAIKIINDKMSRFRVDLKAKTKEYGGRIAQDNDDPKAFYTNIMNERPQPVDHQQQMDQVLSNLQRQGLSGNNPAQYPDIGRRDSDAASVDLNAPDNHEPRQVNHPINQNQQIDAALEQYDRTQKQEFNTRLTQIQDLATRHFKSDAIPKDIQERVYLGINVAIQKFESNQISDALNTLDEVDWLITRTYSKSLGLDEPDAAGKKQNNPVSDFPDNTVTIGRDDD